MTGTKVKQISALKSTSWLRFRFFWGRKELLLRSEDEGILIWATTFPCLRFQLSPSLARQSRGCARGNCGVVPALECSSPTSVTALADSSSTFPQLRVAQKYGRRCLEARPCGTRANGRKRVQMMHRSAILRVRMSARTR